MSFMEIKRFVNSGNTPLNTVIKEEVGGMGGDAKSAKHAIWLNDYKTYGNDSYAYVNKKIYDELMCGGLPLSDITTSYTALCYLSNNNKIGLVLGSIDPSLSTIATVDDMINDEQATAVFVENFGGGGVKSLLEYGRAKEDRMTKLESYQAFNNAVSNSGLSKYASIESAKSGTKIKVTINGTTSTQDGGTVLSNVYLLSASPIYCYTSSYEKILGGLYYKPHGSTNRVSVDKYTAIQKFVKTIDAHTYYYYDSSYSYYSGGISYIPLSGTVQ